MTHIAPEQGIHQSVFLPTGGSVELRQIDWGAIRSRDDAEEVVAALELKLTDIETQLEMRTLQGRASLEWESRAKRARGITEFQLRQAEILLGRFDDLEESWECRFVELARKHLPDATFRELADRARDQGRRA